MQPEFDFFFIGSLNINQLQLSNLQFISRSTILMKTQRLQVFLPSITSIKQTLYGFYVITKVRLGELFEWVLNHMDQLLSALLILYFCLILCTVMSNTNKRPMELKLFNNQNANANQHNLKPQISKNRINQIQQQISRCLQSSFSERTQVQTPILKLVCSLVQMPSATAQQRKIFNDQIQQDSVKAKQHQEPTSISNQDLTKKQLFHKYKQILSEFEPADANDQQNQNMQGQNQLENEDILKFLSAEERQAVIKQYLKKQEDPQEYYLQYLQNNQRVGWVQSEQDQHISSILTKKYKMKNYQEKNGICVVLNTFNNAHNHQIRRTLNSIYNQKYQNYNVIIVDRFSTDDTLALIQKYIQQNPQFKQYTKIAKYKKRTEVQASLYGAQKCYRGEIAILMNGGSELLSRQVFRVVDHFYQKKLAKVLYSDTYDLDIDKKQIKLTRASPYDLSEKFMNLYRDLPRRYGSFFTFQTNLPKHLKKRFLIDSYGEWFKYSNTQALKITLLQLSCSHNYYLPQPFFVNQFQSDLDQSHQSNKLIETRAISRKNKMNIC